MSHPRVMENYRTAHEIAVRQPPGQANTEDLRQAMIHSRMLFEELVGQPELANAKATPEFEVAQKSSKRFDRKRQFGGHKGEG